MGSYTPTNRDPQSEHFDAVVSYLAAISRLLSPAERLDITDTLHELIRRRKRQLPARKTEPQSFSAYAVHASS